jgi:tRNA-2-methylthio-N6-dimethylallyladenosine synthase
LYTYITKESNNFTAKNNFVLLLYHDIINTMNKEKKYCITNYGCQMNYADSERFAAINEEIGYKPTQILEEADLIILNTCSVRQTAEDRILGLTRKMNDLKKVNPELIIVLTGCMARRSWLDLKTKSKSPLQMDQKAREAFLIKEMPWLDYVLESKDYYKLPEKLGIKLESNIDSYLSFKPISKNNYQGWIPISTGCDHFCSYCIVPFARGKEVCRDAESIIKEAQQQIKEGFKDIVLLGQTVNRWVNPRYDLEFKKGRVGNTQIPELNRTLLSSKELVNNDPKDFLQLLQIIDNIEGDFWISFMSSHPNYLTDELIQFMSTSKHIKPYIHFAMQSGSNAVLKRMNRKYSIEEFIDKTQKLKSAIPNLGLSTDVIVGFPKETEEEFLETAEVMKLLGFDMAYISEYSPRKGTASAMLPDDISSKEKTRRKKYLNDEILAVSALAHNKKMIGTIQKALVEKINKGYFYARTKDNKEVRVVLPELGIEIGTFCNLLIKDVTAWALSGELII